MNYNEFLYYIKDNVAEELEKYVGYEGASVDIVKITKNNAIELDGITITKEGEKISPTIYLNGLYNDYLQGKAISTIAEDIVRDRLINTSDIEFKIENIYEFENIKDNIIFRVVNYERNKEQLESCPYIPFNDLAITFRWVAHKDSIGVATSMITNKEVDMWSVSKSDLYKLALENNERIFPGTITNMRKLFDDYMGELNIADESQLDTGVELYVLTNELGINGASCMLYRNILKNFAAQKESNLFILPSSIHEVIVVPESSIDDRNYLRELVESANKTVVGLMDVLSDTVYYYDRQDNKIVVA